MIINFVTGLPKSGKHLVAGILSQQYNVNEDERISELVYSCYQLINNIYQGDTEYLNKAAMLNGLLSGMMEETSTICVGSNWIRLLPMMESILKDEVRMVCMVRNPAEILSEYEREWRNNPTERVDPKENFMSTIASRAYGYSSPEGSLGLSHAALKDLTIMGYKNRLLFVDYNKFCNTPKAQLKRIVDHFGGVDLEFDTSVIKKSTTNCIEYIGLDLYQQYNREIFWNGWI